MCWGGGGGKKKKWFLKKKRGKLRRLNIFLARKGGLKEKEQM